MKRYRVVIRQEGKVERLKSDSLAAAVDLVEARARELADGAESRTVGGKLLRRFEPIQQVTARLELAGPRRLRAGVDVRGDGSVESYTGRVRRELIEQRDGEDAYEALRRTLL
ncbi:MAG: hypothetical protein ACXVRH_12465 [Thermoleophilaceae bacterium]